MAKVMLAMSGGVDSSVAAHLIKQAGFDCVGATMVLCGDAGVQDARAVSERLGIPFYSFDNTREFSRLVIEDFIACYEQGLTPNPCVTCNKKIKFDVLLQQATEMGCDCLATGHYARIIQDNDRFLLYKAKCFT